MSKPKTKTSAVGAKQKVELCSLQIAKKEYIILKQQTLEHMVSQCMGKKAGSEIIKVAGKTATSQDSDYYIGGDRYAIEYQLGDCGYLSAKLNSA